MLLEWLLALSTRVIGLATFDSRNLLLKYFGQVINVRPDSISVFGDIAHPCPPKMAQKSLFRHALLLLLRREIPGCWHHNIVAQKILQANHDVRHQPICG